VARFGPELARAPWRTPCMPAARCVSFTFVLFLRLRQSPVYATPRRNDRWIGAGWRVSELRVGRAVNFKRQTLPSLTDGRRFTSRIPLRTSCVFSYVFMCPFIKLCYSTWIAKPLEIKHTFNTAGCTLGTHGTVQLCLERVKIMFLQSRNAHEARIPDKDHSSNKDRKRWRVSVAVCNEV